MVSFPSSLAGFLGFHPCFCCDLYIASFPGAVDVWFSLRNTTYQNNSIVFLEDIGEGDGALLCVTNQTACCRPPYTDENGSAVGNWSYNVTSLCTSTCTTHPCSTTHPTAFYKLSLLCTQITNTRHSWQNGTRCRDGLKVLWCHSHLVWLVF